MTEKEKLEAGELYRPDDRELTAERVTAKKLCAEYNAAPYNDYQKRERLLDRLLAFKGENIRIEPDFFCNYGYNIILGDNFYANHNCVILDSAEITIGNNVFIGANCCIDTTILPTDAEQRNEGLESAGKIKIGNDVCIGANVLIMSGVSIGDNVVVSGGSVVSEDIPSGVVAGGNPCRVIRKVTEGGRK